jgi:hypothetical protein
MAGIEFALLGQKSDEFYWLGRAYLWKVLFKPTPDQQGAAQQEFGLKSDLLRDVEATGGYILNARPDMVVAARHDTCLLLEDYARQINSQLIPNYHSKPVGGHYSGFTFPGDPTPAPVPPDVIRQLKQNAVDNEVQEALRRARIDLTQGYNLDNIVEPYRYFPRDNAELIDLLNTLDVQGFRRDYAIRSVAEGEVFSADYGPFYLRGTDTYDLATAMEKLAKDFKRQTILDRADDEEEQWKQSPSVKYFDHLHAIEAGISLGFPIPQLYWLFHQLAWRMMLKPLPNGQGFWRVNQYKEAVIQDAEAMTMPSGTLGPDQFVLLRHDTANLLLEYVRQLRAQADLPAPSPGPAQKLAADQQWQVRQVLAILPVLHNFFLLDAYRNVKPDDAELTELFDALGVKPDDRKRILSEKVGPNINGRSNDRDRK